MKTGLPPWQVLRPLAATRVSCTSLVVWQGRRAVLREDRPGARRLGLPRFTEPLVLAAARQAGLGPGCLWADPHRGLLLTEWLPGRACTLAELGQPDLLERAAALLRRLHATPLSAPAVNLPAIVECYAVAAGPGAEELAGEVRAAWAGVSSVGLAERPCFCHNDPTPGNFIAGAGGRLHLIDWEYAGVGLPGLDLAGFALGAGLTAPQVGAFLQAYRGRPPTRAETASQEVWESFVRRLGTLWRAALL